MKNKGFTLIELMICIAIVGIIAAIMLPVFQGNPSPVSNSKRAMMVNDGGVTTSKDCYNGFKLLPNRQQLMNEHGGGVRCE